MTALLPRILFCAALCIPAACSDNDNDDDGPGAIDQQPSYSAKLTRTQYGIPHINADDWGSLGYGHGYAFAQDRFCMLMHEIIRAAGQSSELLGEELGDVNTDLLFSLVNNNDDGQLEEQYLSQQPEQVLNLVEGFAAGVNRYLDETPVNELPDTDPACRGEDFVRPIAAIDLWKYFRLIQLQGSTGQGIIKEAILSVTGPGESTAVSKHSPSTPRKSKRSFVDASLGSNGIALGRDATQNGRGMLLGNPHQPWFGVGSWYQVHLTIPGEYDSMGAALAGFPMVGIGFNKDLAWTQTVSLASRFTLFELKLNPENPLEYIVDGEVKPITPESVSIKVTRTDGSVDTIEHTFYRWEFGLIVSLESAAAGISPATATAFAGWPTAAGTVYAFRDANIDNLRGIDMWIKVAQSENISELVDAYKLIGNPLFHTLAADRNGDMFYGEISAIPNVTQEKLDDCVSGINAAVLSLTNQAIVVLDGDRSECQWGVDDDAPEGSGLFGFSSLPSYTSTDYAVNSNDSYWLSNAENPLEGFPQVMGFIGGEDEQQALRTRINHEMVAARLAGTDGFDGSPGFTVDSLQRLMYENRVAGAEITLTDVLTICDEVRTTSSGSPSEANQLAFTACDQLALWDQKANLDSEGTQVFTEFWRYLRSQLTGGFSNVVSSDDFWRVDFDPAQPLTTPRGIDTTNTAAQTLVMDGLSEAARRISEFNVDLSKPWGEVLVFPRNDVDIPIHGGDGSMGVFGAISSSLSDGGYRNIRAGNSYIQTVTWDDSECPIAEGILTHSQSLDPASPHYSDQSELYSTKAWVSFPFCEADVDNDALAETITLEN